MTALRSLSLGCRDIRLDFASEFTLQVESLDVEAGKTLALLGPSGSGKSTLLLVLGLLVRPDAGTVLLDGVAVTPRDKHARLDMAAVFQRPWLTKGSVGDNVAYGLRLRRIDADRGQRVSSALARVGLAGYENRSAATLSGGEAHRVALARALVLEPRVLLLDEPLASLDPLLKRSLTAEFASILRDEGITVVYVTHDQDEALVVADRLALLKDGRITAQGPADDMLAVPTDPWTASFLGLEEAADGRVMGSRAGLIDIQSAGGVVVAAGAAPRATRVRFSVRPEDVLLFESHAELGPTSARNRLEMQVMAIEPRGATFRVTLEASGLRLAASVSRAAADELRLVPGLTVLAVFKATAVRWRPAEEVGHVRPDASDPGQPGTGSDPETRHDAHE